MHNFGYAEEGQHERVGDARLWWRIVSYCSQHLGSLALAVLLSLAVTAATLAMPRLMQIGIDHSILAETLGPAERVAGLGRVALLHDMDGTALALGQQFRVLRMKDGSGEQGGANDGGGG